MAQSGSTADTLLQNHSSSREPIAIIGIGCRFPGDVHNPHNFWKLLVEGVDAIGEIPRDRWLSDAFYDPNPATPGKTHVRWGGFVRNIDRFDAEFFGISPREAARIDPQQRLLLEVAYEALEDGGQAPERLTGSQTGVFLGVSTCDYGGIQLSVTERQSLDAYTHLGMGASIASNRISYLFDFHGPSMTVDTACSSSLVAAHLACQSIWNGECALAMAGGVNIILRPETTIGFTKASMLAPDGRCKSFDARANGYVRSEGGGIVLLKPLAAALAAADPIYAVIRGTGVNEDGRTSGIALPSGPAQEALLRQVYERAGISGADVAYVEAHGTGTAAGDPIEMTALGRVLAENRPEGNYCMIGSVKTNIGHLEAAAGIAGLIKAALVLKHQQIPANLHFQDPNPQVSFEKLRLRVPRTLQSLSQNGSRFVGVNSFGFGGANAHVLMEGPPNAEPAAPSAIPENQAWLLPLSARSDEALRALALDYLSFLSDGAAPALSDICFTASMRRSHFQHRLAVVAHSKKELQENLQAFLSGESRHTTSAGRQSAGSPKLVMVFSGMGPQWWGMGRQLLDEAPEFSEVIRACDALLRPLIGWSLEKELRAPEHESRILRTEVAQPATFALQLGLAAVLRSWGVQPDAIVGHSVGEVAACYVAGVLSLEDAIRVIFHRSRLQQRIAGKGQMLAAGISEEQAQELLAGYEDRVSIAAVNSPLDVTFSGETAVLNQFAESLRQRQAFCRVLQVEVPYHSPQMDALQSELLQSLTGLRPRQSAIPIVSTVTGSVAAGAEMDRNYWWDNVRKPVRFRSAIDALVQSGHNTFIEVGAQPVLSHSIASCLENMGREGAVFHTLRRQEPERAQLLGCLGKLYVQSYPVSWDRLGSENSRIVKLPGYPWQRERFWSESEQTRRDRLGEKLHPLLGNQLDSAHPGWGCEISTHRLPYLNDHRVQESVVFPAAAYVEMALACAKQVFGEGPAVVEDLHLERAMVLPVSQDTVVHLFRDPGQGSFEIYSRTGGVETRWLRHATGKLRRLQEPAPRQQHLHEIQRRCATAFPRSLLYRQLNDLGFQHGPAFQRVERLWVGEGEALGEIQFFTQPDGDSYQLHPCLLDACFQVLHGAMASGGLQGTFPGPMSVTGLFLPVRIDGIRFYRQPLSPLFSFVRLTEFTRDHVSGDVELIDDQGTFAEIHGFRCRAIERSPAASVDNYLYEYKWKLQQRPGLIEETGASDYLLTPEQIADRIQPQAATLSAQFGAEHYGLTAELDTLLTPYVLQAFKKLGFTLSVGRRFSARTFVEEFAVAAHHTRLLERIFSLWEEDGILRRIDDEWEVRQVPLDVDAGQLWKSLWDRCPATQAELLVGRQCAEQLAEVLRGDVDPLHLIFPQGSTDITEHLYQDSTFYRVYNLLVQRSVGAALEKLPDTQTLRILEVGGGTGGMTAYVLRKLPSDRTDYLFTDVTQLFLTKAQQKFHEFPFVRYVLLDIEQDPLSQGFEPHSFDLILASDVLHATQDLNRTLGNIKHLLASRGLLVLLEGTNFPRMLLLVFGLLRGWWLFEDDVRQRDPWISQSSWKDILLRTGFSEVSCLADTDDPARALHSVFIAQGPVLSPGMGAVRQKPVTRTAPGVWMVLTDRGGIGQDIAARLKAEEQHPILISAGAVFHRQTVNQFEINPGSAEDMVRVLQMVRAEQLPLRGIVYLWNLDVAPPLQTDRAALEAALTLGCMSAVRLVQALSSESSDSPRLWMVTRGAHAVSSGDRGISVTQAPLWGLDRVIMNEYPAFRCTTLDLSLDATSEEIQSFVEELLADAPADEIALRGKARFVHRLQRLSTATIQRPVGTATGRIPYALQNFNLGVLDSLKTVAITPVPPARGEIQIEADVAALNFKDVMAVMNLLPEEARRDGYGRQLLGMECAGRVTALGDGVEHFKVGDAVVMVCPGALRTHVTADARFATHIPASLSFEEAATIPAAFLTAYYSLHYLARIRAGERVLIHSAAGGVGLAAIQWAQRAGAEVFASAGSPVKRALLTALGVRHVVDSRSLAFADEVMKLTGGKGVDIVLNSLAGEAVAKGLSVLSPDGRFIEIGKRDIFENAKMELAPFRKSLSYFAVDLDHIWAERPDFFREMLNELMAGFADGSLRPLSHRLFSIADVTNAFRHMAQGRHIGKLVISLRDQEVVVTPAPPPQKEFRSDATYLITGGLGGFGLATARWLVDHGARHLVLMGRSGASTHEAEAAVLALQEVGTEVVVAKADVANTDDVIRVIDDIRRSMPPLRGVIHAAMVLDDAVLTQLDELRMRRTMEPKVAGAWNLHTLTANMDLDLFVLFSSFGSTVGPLAQGNYAAANAFLDALAHHRRGQGLPALAVNWGAVADAGYVAQNAELHERLGHHGQLSLPAQVMLDILGRLLQTARPQVGVSRFDWKQMVKAYGMSALMPRYADVAAISQSDDGELGRPQRLAEVVSAAEPEKRRQVLESLICVQLAKVLGTSTTKIDVDRPLLDLGLDSLMALETTNHIQTEVGVKVPPMKFMERLTVSGLAAFVLEELNASSDRSTASSAEREETLPPHRRSVEVEFVCSVTDLEADTVLDAEIQPPGVVADPGPQPNILLTGSTGFLGAFLLAELLNTTNANLYCLTRCTNVEAGAKRIYENFRRFLPTNDYPPQRVIPVPGDLSQPLFGLSVEQFDLLATKIDTIYHNGAWINWLYSYEKLRPTNVLGTREVLRLASRTKTKPVHYISTLVVFPLMRPGGPPTIREDDSLDHSGELLGGYTQTKWVAEKLMTIARSRNLPVTIYRPGMISGDSRSGVSNTKDVFNTIIKSWVDLGEVPDIDASIDMTPVDYVSRAIVYLSRLPHSPGRVFHLFNPETVVLSDLADWISRFGFPLRRISYEQWRTNMMRRTATPAEDPLSSLAPFFAWTVQQKTLGTAIGKNESPESTLDWLGVRYARGLARIDSQSTSDALSGSSIACPRVDANVFERYFSYFRQRAFIGARAART